MASGQLRDIDNAAIFIQALPRILDTIDTNSFPFIAKVFRDSRGRIVENKAQGAQGASEKEKAPQ
jgi:hypothetical protein